MPTDPAEQVLACEQRRLHAPQDVENLLALGTAYIDAGRLLDAVAVYEEVLRIDARRAEAHLRLACLFFDTFDLFKAAQYFESLHAVHGVEAATAIRLGMIHAYMGRFDQARTLYRRVLDAPNVPPNVLSQALMLLNYDPSVSPAKLAALHRAAALKFGSPRPKMIKPRVVGAKVRIGYVSPDFYNHACAIFLLPLLKAHDRSRFEVYCYANNAVSDKRTRHFEEIADAWRDIKPLDDVRAAELIAADEIDVLIDCAGHSLGNRLSLFALKPAPVQVSFLGYPTTTGLPAMDYHLTDPVADPPEETPPDFSEKRVRLPNGFLTYMPYIDVPLPPPGSARHDGGLAFGCFNNWLKVGPKPRAVWAEILKRVPGSTLVLKDKMLASSDIAAQVRSEFASRGVDPSRIVFKTYNRSQSDHMMAYHAVDIALDTFPYNGTTTTCDSLWMGLPVVTLRGDRHAARLGASILSRVGLSDLVARDYNDYIRIAVTLAGDTERLANLHRGLRQQLVKSPLGQPQLIARDIETFYDAVSRGGPAPFT